MPGAEIVVAQLGARQHYEIPRMCHAHGALARLHTDFWKPVPGVVARAARALQVKAVTRLAGRATPGIPDRLVTAHAAPALYWNARLRIARSRGDQFLNHMRWGSRFAQRVAVSLERERFTTYFGFSSASLEAIEAAKRAGALTVLDEIAPYHLEDEILGVEQARFPGWEPEAGATPRAYLERLEAEWAACDRIMVNSRWSRDALVDRGVSAGKISVVPISFEPLQPTGRAKTRGRDEPLRVLWLGSLCLRKGLPYAIEAARLLARAPVHFTFAGPAHVDLGKIEWPQNCTYVGQVPRSSTQEVWNAHHVFLLPTLSDGFAITQIEAMAHGLPIVVTRACGDVVQDGKNGLLVPTRDAAAIVEALTRFLDGEIDLEAASRAAMDRARDFSAEAIWRQLEPVLTPGRMAASSASP